LAEPEDRQVSVVATAPEMNFVEADEVANAEATFRLRLAEAKIYRKHVEALRASWLWFAFLSWVLTFGALFMALLPYLQLRSGFAVAEVISYVSAFVVVIAAAFALVSSYRSVIATRMVANATFYIERALAVASTFNVEVEARSSNGS
jgi:hypothetical protein